VTLRSYYVACNMCAKDYHPYSEIIFNQKQPSSEGGRWECGDNRWPTYCYKLDEDTIQNMDYGSCPKNEYQQNMCHYWKEGSWLVKNSKEEKDHDRKSPYGEGCAVYDLCKYDEGDHHTDDFFVQW